MFTMDFKHQGITWVGNIYQKFEAMCLEVDDIICQDTVKYVEDQVQTVGDNVKKFCSDVMQDLLPPSAVEPVKGAAAPDLSLEQNADAKTCKKSKVDIEEDPEAVDMEESLVESDVNVPMENELGPTCASSVGQLHNVTHPLLPSSMDPAEMENSDLSLRQTDDVEMDKMAKVDFEDDPIKFELLPSEMLDVIAPVLKDSSGTSLLDGFVKNDNELESDKLVNLSPPTSLEVTKCNSLPKAGKISDNHVHGTDNDADVSITLPSSNVVLPVVSCEDKVAESGITPYGGDLSSESSGLDTSATYEAVAIVECTGNRHDKCSKPAQLEAFMSTPEIARSNDNAEEIDVSNVIISSLEMSEPFDKVKLEESCVVVDTSELGYVSTTGSGMHKSYKKKIRDAFASKMRLGKKQDNEQQAIWYSDIDAGSNQQRVESFTSSNITTDLESKKHDFCESEWELL